DDVFPPGSKATCTSRNAATWSTAPEIEPPLGRRALKQAFASNYQDKFENPTRPQIVPEYGRLTVWVRIDAHEVPQTILLQLDSNQGSHKALWGEPKEYGVARTDQNWMGEIPEKGRWTRLEVPLDKINLKPEASVN